MSDLLNRRLALLSDPKHLPSLGQGLRGIEREALRVSDSGELAQTPHPAGLGSALTHEQITTDYSEALLEFITPAMPDVADVLDHLRDIHRFASACLDGEVIWSTSMPCVLPAEEQIPIARYGSSHIGQLKHVYRQGLAVRYGRRMQCIAGLHYNFSLSPAIWELLRTQEGSTQAAQDYQSESYIRLIRNFRRHSWLLMYLFGASPVLPTSFLAGASHKLETLGDDTLYLPYATSLRMSDLGYQNNAQAGIVPDYNDLQSYLRHLTRAVNQPYAAYEAIGTQRDGQWIQLSTNVLQIENEYYSTIRPKCVVQSGERPVQALMARGVQYVEVRCMDVDPFTDVGISLDTSRFLDVFLHYLALSDGPPTCPDESQENTANFALVATQGRKPGLMLQRSGQPLSLQQWGEELLAQMLPVASLLDEAAGGDEHRRALAAQQAKIADVSLTLSARALDAVRAAGNSFTAYTLQHSQEMTAGLRADVLPAGKAHVFADMAQQSLVAQRDIEAADKGDFDTFVAAYMAAVPVID